jgi:hypothetical protein
MSRRLLTQLGLVVVTFLGGCTAIGKLTAARDGTPEMNASRRSLPAWPVSGLMTGNENRRATGLTIAGAGLALMLGAWIPVVMMPARFL